MVGNAIAERPDLFGAAIIQVGLSNMLRYETTANGVPNIPKFGSVKTEDGFKNLLQMDAYQKIKEGVKYPAVMLTHGINDPRVEPWFSAKLAARLQAASASKNRSFSGSTMTPATASAVPASSEMRNRPTCWHF